MTQFSDLGIQIPDEAHGQIKTLCPQCSSKRTKSDEKCLSVNIDEGIFHCHHCEWSGSLSGNTDVTPIPEFSAPDICDTSLIPAEIIDYFRGRGISQEVIARNGVTGFTNNDGKYVIKFPYIQNGAVVNNKYRTVDDKKFWQDKDGLQIPYKMDDCADVASFIITEGEIDALSFEEAGFKNAVSVPSGAINPNTKATDKKMQFLNEVKEVINRVNRIILATDCDAPGNTLAEELARRIGLDKCFRVTFPEGCKDANDVLVKHGPDKLCDIISNAKPWPVKGIYTLGENIDEVIDFYENGFRPGESTGYFGLDQLYKVRRGELTIVTGKPGDGKSEFLDQLIVNLNQKYSHRFVYYSPENFPVARHIVKLVEKVTKQPFMKNSVGRISKKELVDALTVLGEDFTFILQEDDIPNLDWILDSFKYAIRRYGCVGCVIDPWNMIEHQHLPGVTETDYISACLSKIKLFAITHNVHFWVVAHPQKLQQDSDGKFPVVTPYHISGSSNWFNKADNILSVYRHYTKPSLSKSSNQTVVTIHVQKVRFKEIGRRGEVSLNYDPVCGIYLEEPQQF